jgi:transcriptional regulator with XRE-family HTH domain
MKIPIQSVEDLGLVIRAVRKSAHVRQDDLASTVQVSKQFTADVERGKPTVQMGRVLLLLEELGIPLSVEMPETALDALQRLQAKRASAKAQPE